MIAMLYRLRRWFSRLLHPQRLDSQLADELHFHIESETALLVARGKSEAEARRIALAQLGGVQRWREEVRDQRPAHALELLMREVSLSLRSLRRAHTRCRLLPR